MFFIKANQDFSLPIDESANISSDLVSIANEIELECAMYNFETVHEAVETFHSVLEEDAGGDEKSRFQKFKDKMGAAKDKFVAFLKRVWQRIKDMFTKVIYWISTKISSNKSFAEKMGKENLGKVKVKYDYSASFKAMSDAYPKLNTLGNAYMELFKAKDFRKEVGKDVRNDKDFASQFDDEVLDEYTKTSGVGSPDSVGKIKEEYRKGICVEKEEEVEGKNLLNILTTYAPTVDGFKKFNVGIMNFFKALEGQIKNPSGDISVKVGLNPIYKVLTLISSLVSTTIVCAQKLILAIRSDIKRSKGGSSDSGKAAEDNKGGEAKTDDTKNEPDTSAAYFTGMLDSLI